jgi:DNA-binding GntR family transcriptional regulator
MAARVGSATRSLKQAPRRKRRPAPNHRASQPDANVTERTYHALLDMILGRELPPGEVIEERKLAAALDVSRTPLRNAMSRLLGEGVLSRLSNGAPTVHETSVAEFLEILHVRRVLESEAAALAAGRVPAATLGDLRRRLRAIIARARARKEEHWTLDDELHDVIADCAGNRTLAQMISAARRRARLCNIERVPGRLIPACEEHLAIIDALGSSEGGDAARAAMAAHLDNVRRNFLRGLGVPEAPS